MTGWQRIRTARFEPPPLDVPLVKAGQHFRPRDGACLLELVTVYSHEPWGDHPQCVDPVLAAISRGVNDRMSDGRRGELIPFAPVLAGSAVPDARASAAATMACLDPALPIAPPELRRDLVAAIDIATGLRAAPGCGWGRAGLQQQSRLRRLARAARDAVALVADAEPDPDARDRVLYQLLDHAIDAVGAVRRLPPRRHPQARVTSIRVRREWVHEEGCDWRSLVCVPVDDVERDRVFGAARHRDRHIMVEA